MLHVFLSVTVYKVKRMQFEVWFGGEILDLTENLSMTCKLCRATNTQHSYWDVLQIHLILSHPPQKGGQISSTVTWNLFFMLQIRSLFMRSLQTYLTMLKNPRCNGKLIRLSKMFPFLCSSLLFLHLCPVLSFVLSVFVHPLLETSLGWLNYICISEVGDDEHERLRFKFYLCNLNKLKL